LQRTVQRQLADYSPEQLFALVSDIESYPDFIPHCIGARIRRRSGQNLVVENMFGAGPVRVRFITHAMFDPPTAIDVVSADGPFESLKIAWRFTAVEGGTRAEFSIETRFRRRIVERLSHLLNEPTEQKVLDAFERRARKTYGGDDQ